MTSQIGRRRPSIMLTVGIFVLAVELFKSPAQNKNHIANGLAYPKTRQVEQVDGYHGIRVKDPFRWLENMESEEARQWVDAQDELTKNFLATVPALSAIHRSLCALNDLVPQLIFIISRSLPTMPGIKSFNELIRVLLRQ